MPNPTGWVDPLGLSSCPDEGKNNKGNVENPALTASVIDKSPPPPAPKNADKWSSEPKSIQDQMTLQAAQQGFGREIIKNLADARFKGMTKVERKTKSHNGRDSVVHYVRAPQTNNFTDFKFKKHSTDNIKPWGSDPSVPPGDKK